MHYEGLFIPLGFFFLVAYIVRTVSDNKIRQSLIDKGFVKEDVKYLYQNKIGVNAPASLKWGMVLIAIGLAIFIGRNYYYRFEEVMFGLMFLLAGAALVLYYFIAKSIAKKQQAD